MKLTIEIDYNNQEIHSKRFDVLENETLDSIISYLEENNFEHIEYIDQWIKKFNEYTYYALIFREENDSNE